MFDLLFLIPIALVIIAIAYELRERLTGPVYCKPQADYYLARMKDHIKRHLGK